MGIKGKQVMSGTQKGDIDPRVPALAPMEADRAPLCLHPSLVGIAEAVGIDESVCAKCRADTSGDIKSF